MTIDFAPAMNAGAGSIDPAIFAQLAVASVTESTSGDRNEKQATKNSGQSSANLLGFRLVSGLPDRCDAET
ncbi:hypothetical protein NZK35_32920 [Stieleria sp. ICT_E10.1]|uniref:hypothetical protein n=1 Tax=Stieleria sedimenti TaxID=2976331 RepID=UPI0021804929|nr:hypothetical protein [Stieleria sedimenti]MCS7471476.1 hypothetical protein [Stieleria sedimenti]